MQNECRDDIREKWHYKRRNIGCSEGRATRQIPVVSTNVGTGRTQVESQAADGQSPAGRAAAVLHT
jgi:hypothetical protein